MRALRLLAIFAAGLVVALVAALLILPTVVERMKDDLVQRVAAAVGEDVRLESLQLELISPRLRLSGLQVGSPPHLGAGSVTIAVNVLESLRRGRVHASVAMGEVVVDLYLPSTEGGDPKRGSAPFLPPLDVAAVLDSVKIVLSDDRTISARHLDAALNLDAGGDALLRADGEGLEILRGSQRTVVDSMHADARWARATLFVDSLQVRGSDLVVDAQPAAAAGDTVGGFAPTAVQANGELGPVIDFFAGEVGIDGRASVEFEISGAFGDPVIDGKARVERPAVAGATLGRLDAEIRRAGRAWRGENVEVTWPAGRLVGDVGWNESDWKLRGDAGWRDVDVAALLGWPERRHVMSSGDAQLEIDFIDFRVAADGKGRLAGAALKPIPFDATFTTDGGGFAGSLDLAVDAANRLRARVDRADPQGLVGEATLQIASIEGVLQAFGYDGPIPATGGLQARGEMSGTLGKPSIAVRVDSKDLRLSGGVAAELRAAGTISPEQVTIATLSVATAGGVVEGVGKFAVASGGPNDWTMRLLDVELQPLLETLHRSFGLPVAGVAGNARGRVAVTGSWSSLDAKSELTVRGAALSGIELGTVKIEATSKQGAWQADIVARGESTGRGEIELRGSGPSLHAVAGSVREWPLQTLFVRGGAKPGARTGAVIGGTVSVEGKVEAVARGADGTLQLSVQGLQVDDQTFADSRINAVAKGAAWDVDGLLLGEAVQLDATVGTSRDGPFDAKLRWSDVRVPLPLVEGEIVEVTSRGSVTASGRLGTLADTNASLEVEDLSIERGRQRLVSEGPIRAALVDGRLRLSSLQITGEGTRLSAIGDVGPEGDTKLSIEGTFGLEWLQSFVSSVEEATGTAELTLEVVGSPDTPLQISGKASVRKGGLEIKGLPPATKLRGDIEFSASAADIRTLRGEIGGGKFSLTGRVDREAGPALEWSFREVSLEPVGHLEVVATGSGTLSGDWQHAILAGDIAIPSLLYDRNLEFQDLIPSFDRAMAPRVGASRQGRPPLRLALRVRARDGLHVENNIARLEGRCDLEIKGTARDPSVRGNVEIIDGQISLRGRSFQVINGVLTFQPEVPGKAYIDFLAESIIDSGDVPYRVQVRVTGSTDAYRVVLDSDEGLSQTDIASLIAFGKTVSQLQEGGSAGSGFSVDKLAEIAGGQVGGFVAGEIKDVLPFDEIELRPGFSPITGQFEPQLRLGKTITEDLSAWIAQTFGVQSQTTVEMSYALTRQISTTLRWESQTASQEGAFGGELSQRFEFWGLPNWLSWGDPPAAGGSE